MNKIIASETESGDVVETNNVLVHVLFQYLSRYLHKRNMF